MENHEIEFLDRHSKKGIVSRSDGLLSPTSIAMIKNVIQPPQFFMDFQEELAIHDDLNLANDSVDPCFHVCHCCSGKYCFQFFRLFV